MANMSSSRHSTRFALFKLQIGLKRKGGWVASWLHCQFGCGEYFTQIHYYLLFGHIGGGEQHASSLLNLPFAPFATAFIRNGTVRQQEEGRYFPLFPNKFPLFSILAAPASPRRQLASPPHRESRTPVVHPPGIRPPKGVAGTLNKAKLKDFMRIGREILRRRRLLRSGARQWNGLGVGK